MMRLSGDREMQHPWETAVAGVFARPVENISMTLRPERVELLSSFGWNSCTLDTLMNLKDRIDLSASRSVARMFRFVG